MTEKTFKRSGLRHSHGHLVRRLFSRWPWMIWVGAALAVILLLPGGMHPIRFHGVAERIYENVAPLSDARLKNLTVDVGDTVTAGQILGELDSEDLATELLMDQASLMKTRDKIHSIRFDMEMLKLEQAKAAAELQTLKSRWARIQSLLEKNLVLEQEIEDLQPQIRAAEAVLERYPYLLKQLEVRLQAAEEDSLAFSGGALQELRSASGLLRATMSGIVAEIIRQPGDVVETGDPILRISNMSTHRVIAFMPDDRRMEIEPGDKCRIITLVDRTMCGGTIQSVTADIRKLPVFTGFSNQVLRGRRIIVELDEGEVLMPGEQVVMVPDISLLSQWFGRWK